MQYNSPVVRGPVFPVDQIIDKTLYAKQAVPLYRVPGGEVVYTVTPGNVVGVVFSYLAADPAGGRDFLYWAFKDADGSPYYAAHRTGAFDVGSIEGQGGKTVLQLIEEKEAAQETFLDQLGDVLPAGGLGNTLNLVLVAAAVYFGYKLFK